eukprot:749853-Hanusia_phi.AAC.5
MGADRSERVGVSGRLTNTERRELLNSFRSSIWGEEGISKKRYSSVSMGDHAKQEIDLLSRIQSATLCSDSDKPWRTDLTSTGLGAESSQRFQSARQKFMEEMKKGDVMQNDQYATLHAPKSERYLYQPPEREFNPSELQKLALTDRMNEHRQEGATNAPQNSKMSDIISSSKLYIERGYQYKEHYHDPLASHPDFYQTADVSGPDLVDKILDAPKSLLSSVFSLFGHSPDHLSIPFFKTQDLQLDSNPSMSKIESAENNPQVSENKLASLSPPNVQGDSMEEGGLHVDVLRSPSPSSSPDPVALQALEERVKASLTSNNWSASAGGVLCVV